MTSWGGLASVNALAGSKRRHGSALTVRLLDLRRSPHSRRAYPESGQTPRPCGDKQVAEHERYPDGGCQRQASEHDEASIKVPHVNATTSNTNAMMMHAKLPTA